MKKLPITPLTFECPFDMESYMLLTETKRLDGDMAERISTYWEKWLPRLKAYRLGENKGYVTAFFEREVEQEIDAVWTATPSKGFELECVAQTMIMVVMQQILPKAGNAGCAPVPEPNEALSRSLKSLGLDFTDAGHLTVKYGVISQYPYRGGCEICYLEEACPKKMFSSTNQ